MSTEKKQAEARDAWAKKLQAEGWRAQGAALAKGAFAQLVMFSPDGKRVIKAARIDNGAMDGWPMFIAWAMRSRSRHVPVVYRHWIEGELLFVEMERLHEMPYDVYWADQPKADATRRERTLVRQWKRLRNQRSEVKGVAPTLRTLAVRMERDLGRWDDLHVGNVMVRRYDDGRKELVLTDPYGHTGSDRRNANPSFRRLVETTAPAAIAL